MELVPEFLPSVNGFPTVRRLPARRKAGLCPLSLDPEFEALVPTPHETR